MRDKPVKYTCHPYAYYMYVCVYFLFLFISNKVYKLTHGTESGLSLKPPQLDAESNPGMSEHVCVCVCVCVLL